MGRRLKSTVINETFAAFALGVFFITGIWIATVVVHNKTHQDVSSKYKHKSTHTNTLHTEVLTLKPKHHLNTTHHYHPSKGEVPNYHLNNIHSIWEMPHHHLNNNIHPIWEMPEFMFGASEEATKDRLCPIGSHQLTDTADLRKSRSSLSTESNHVPIRRKIVHLTMYDCELSMLELKLAEMGPVLYKIVIGEASMTNSNIPRAACFPQAAKQSPIVRHYVDIGKIHYEFMDNVVENFVYWEAEVHYRNQLSLPLLNMGLAPDDLVLLSDMDEIVARPFLKLMTEEMRDLPGSEVGLKVSLRWSYYGFQWVNTGPSYTNAVVTWNTLQTRCNMKANEIRRTLCGGEDKADTWEMVGWHCSWCFPTEKFLDKIKNSAHAPDMGLPMYNNISFLRSQRKGGLWFMTQTPNACFAERGEDRSFSPNM